MVPRRDDELPFDAVRDLVGLVRAMYVEAAGRDASPGELGRIAAIGVDLTDALDLAACTPPGTVGHRAAWARAERAARSLGDLVTLTDPAQRIVEAARRRVRDASGR